MTDGPLSRDQLAGKAQTVLGLLPPEKLGVTLPHEHLFADLTIALREYEPDNDEERELAAQPVSMENLWWVRRHVCSSRDNVLLQDEQLAIKEASYCRQAGGRTIVDVTTDQFGRNPVGLVRVAEATGLNIIMGSGYYIGSTHPDDMDARGEDAIHAAIVRDITVGVRDTGVRAGIIGEIGCTHPLRDGEHKALRAAAAAQRDTGAALTVHPGRTAGPGIAHCLEIVDILAGAGGDLSRTIMCHIDRMLRDPDARRKLAETGCYLEYDMFGWEGYHSIPTLDLPNDNQRINEIMLLIEQGYMDRILVSQDIGWKSSLRSYGGHGYGHILRDVLPVMRLKGVTDDQIEALMVDNPRRLLRFV